MIFKGKWKLLEMDFKLNFNYLEIKIYILQ